MNKISSEIITSYDRRILSVFIDGVQLSEYFGKQTTDYNYYKGLWSAWLLKCDENDGKYMWTLLDEERECNVPVLLCPDDMDFWCTVIVAKVRFSGNTVIWEKIGAVSGKYDIKLWRESGINNTALWSDEDFALYGKELYGLDSDDKAWEKWWSENWENEEMRRIWNYIHLYFNDDRNIRWSRCGRLIFDIKEYRDCVLSFKGFKY